MPVEQGDWVIMKQGPYRGDMGCVLANHDWGLDALVVPRLFQLEHIHTRNRNRSHTKHGLWHCGETFYHFGTSMEVHAITKPRWNEKSEIEHGLLVLECRHDSIVPATTAALPILDLFLRSAHPTVLAAEYRAPCPHEWRFEKDEHVEVLRRGIGGDDARQGRVVAMNTHGVEINLNDGAGVHLYPFYDVVKVFNIGDCVHDVDGKRDSFVQSVLDFHLSVLMTHKDGKLEVTFSSSQQNSY